MSQQKLPDKDAVVAGWRFVLEHATTLSPGMRDLIETTIVALESGSPPSRQKAVNTWEDMLSKGDVPDNLRKQVYATLTLM